MTSVPSVAEHDREERPRRFDVARCSAVELSLVHSRNPSSCAALVGRSGMSAAVARQDHRAPLGIRCVSRRSPVGEGA